MRVLCVCVTCGQKVRAKTIEAILGKIPLWQHEQRRQTDHAARHGNGRSATDARRLQKGCFFARCVKATVLDVATTTAKFGEVPGRKATMDAMTFTD